MFYTPKFLWFVAPHMFPDGSQAKKAAIKSSEALKYLIAAVGVSVGFATMFAFLNKIEIAYGYGGIAAASLISMLMFMREMSGKFAPFMDGCGYTETQVKDWQEACSAHSFRARVTLCILLLPAFLAYYIRCLFKQEQD